MPGAVRVVRVEMRSRVPFGTFVMVKLAVLRGLMNCAPPTTMFRVLVESTKALNAPVIRFVPVAAPPQGLAIAIAAISAALP